MCDSRTVGPVLSAVTSSPSRGWLTSHLRQQTRRDSGGGSGGGGGGAPVPQYLGGPAAAAAGGADRERAATRARLTGASLLGALSPYIVQPMPGKVGRPEVRQRGV